MSHAYTIEDLEALAAGHLDAAHTKRIEAHLECCDECAEELSWLHIERDAFAARAGDVDDAHIAALWQGVSARIDIDAGTGADTVTPIASRRRSSVGRIGWFGAGFGAAAVAAAVMMFVMRPPATGATAKDTHVASPTAVAGASSADQNRVDARKAIADAEAAYTRAIKSLEGEYVAKRGTLDPQVAAAHDATFARNRALLSEAKTTAGDDIEGRMLSLDAYAQHVRTLQDVVGESD